MRRLVPVLRTLAFAAALAVLIAVGIGAAKDVKPGDLTWWLVAASLAPTAFWWLLLARGWSLLVGGGVTRYDVGVWCRTQVLRYLPGGFWAPVSRVAVLDGKSLDRISTVAAENLVALCAALSLGGVALAVAGEWRWLPLVALAAAPPLAARYTASRTRLEPARVRLATRNYLTGFLAYMLGCVFVQAAVSGFQAPLEVAGAAAIAWSAGLVVVFAPGGIGVREVVYVALLAGTFGRSEPAAAAVTMRLVTILAEFAVLIAAGRPGESKNSL